jgi:hypothetical protein
MRHGHSGKLIKRVKSGRGRKTKKEGNRVKPEGIEE